VEDRHDSAKTLLPVLLEALKDKDANVRAAAAPVIVLFGAKAKPALPALVGGAQGQGIQREARAITALGDLGAWRRFGRPIA